MLDPLFGNIEVPPMAEADYELARAIAARGDIYAHLPALRWLVEDAKRNAPKDSLEVVEFGVRVPTSTWALLAGRPAALTSVDIQRPPDDELRRVERAAHELGVIYDFTRCSTLDLRPVSCDVLFIDTLHTGAQLRGELARHAAGVRDYIAFHDTETFGTVGEDGQEPGLVAAIEELLDADGSPWELIHHDPACNGLTVVTRRR